MQQKKLTKDVERQFSPVYEKLIPSMIAILFILMVGMLVLTICIALGWITF